jgi:hypothetical protein
MTEGETGELKDEAFETKEDALDAACREEARAKCCTLGTTVM